ncbi:MAG: leucyl aminopeptidase [Symbiobacterium sp.]|uniref:M17 family metallopeptidase n=1 Tax=Symbiobacterium sp. TaxID=1971213 RepID=UPI0034645392
MKVAVSNQALTEIAVDVLILPLTEGTPAPAEVNEALDGLCAQVVGADFKGEMGETVLLYTAGKLPARKVLLLGLGKAEKVTNRSLRRAAGIGARAARRSGGRSIAFAQPQSVALAPAEAARFITEGVLHGLYRLPSWKTERKEQPEVEAVQILGGDEVAAGVEWGRAVAEGVNLARGLAWTPGNHMTATMLAERAVLMCRECGIEVTVYDRKGCEELGLGLLLAVNQGSREEPRFIVMRYKGAGGQGPWLGLVGKGLTFDSGGISIKPTDGMWNMKMDMGGAAAVIGALRAIARLKIRADVMGVIPATDNMPDGGSYKPGDVIAGLSGKTVEIRSTDAEGRLILADGLAYAARNGCQKIITASTLTGAANIALGPIRFGLVANDDAWEDEVYEAAEAAGERGWRLPHDEEYYDLLKSPIADMINGTRNRAAGTVAGGLFLMRHVGNTPCVHMDIAALAWKSPGDEYEDEGATGAGTRTFVEAARRFAEGSH